jgi:hypothetical protein
VIWFRESERPPFRVAVWRNQVENPGSTSDGWPLPTSGYQAD